MADHMRIELVVDVLSRIAPHEFEERACPGLTEQAPDNLNPPLGTLLLTTD